MHVIPIKMRDKENEKASKIMNEIQLLLKTKKRLAEQEPAHSIYQVNYNLMKITSKMIGDKQEL